MTEDQYRKLKQEVDTAKASADKARGALEQLQSRLQEEFDCADLKTAKRRLRELSEERDDLKTKLDKTLQAYEEKWHELEA